MPASSGTLRLTAICGGVERFNPNYWLLRCQLIRPDRSAPGAASSPSSRCWSSCCCCCPLPKMIKNLDYLFIDWKLLIFFSFFAMLIYLLNKMSSKVETDSFVLRANLFITVEIPIWSEPHFEYPSIFIYLLFSCHCCCYSHDGFSFKERSHREIDGKHVCCLPLRSWSKPIFWNQYGHIGFSSSRKFLVFACFSMRLIWLPSTYLL